MSGHLANLTEAMLDAARRAGADAADALAVSSRSLSIEVLHGRLEHAERAEGIDIGLRVLIGKRQANVSSSDTRAETIAEMAERAVAMAREAPADSSVGLAETGQLSARRDADGLELADPSAEPEPKSLEADAMQAEAAALAVGGVSQVQGASAGYSRTDIHLAMSNGFSGGYARKGRSTSCVAIAGTGLSMERDYSGESRTYQGDLTDAASIGTEAGERAIADQAGFRTRWVNWFCPKAWIWSKIRSGRESRARVLSTVKACRSCAARWSKTVVF